MTEKYPSCTVGIENLYIAFRYELWEPKPTVEFRIRGATTTKLLWKRKVLLRKGYFQALSAGTLEI